MPECRYCGESFEDDDTYLTHLESAHPEDLGPIDRRRLSAEQDTGGTLGIGTGPLALGAIVLVVAAVAVYITVFAGGNGDTSSGVPTPHSVGNVHYHGTIEVAIDGTRIDFSRPVFQYRNTGVDAFHFEGGDGSRWHVHAQGVTLQRALASLGIEVTADSVTVDGTTYRDGAQTTVIIEVNGNSVDPSTYILQPEDHIRIVVR